MAASNSNLNNVFVWVPQDKVQTYKTSIGIQDAYKGKIAFLEGMGEIMTQGTVFGLNRADDITALQNIIGGDNTDFATGVSATTIIDFLNELNGVVNTNTSTIGDSSSGLVKRVTDLETSVDTTTTGLKDRMTAVEGKTNTLVGSDSNKSARTIAAEEVAKVVDSAPTAFDTLKEIADWIGTGNVENTTAATMLSDISSLKTDVGNASSGVPTDPDYVAPTGLHADVETLRADLNAMTGGNGSISTQIDNKVATLDSSVTLTGTTASQPGTITRSTRIDVLGSVTISETDGKIDAEAAGKSAKVVLQADAAGAAAQAYADLLGTVSDSKDTVTLYGVKAYVDDKTTGLVNASGEEGAQALITASASNNTVTVASSQRLQTAVGLAERALQYITISSGDSNTLGITPNAQSGNDGATITPKTGTLSTGTTTSLTADTTNGKLATVDNIASAINGITLWQTYTS